MTSAWWKSACRVVLACTLPAACGGGPAEGAANDSAVEARSTDPWQWAEAPKAVFANGNRATAIADGPEAARVDFWIKAIDARERALHPDSLANVPVPNAFVVKSKQPDAFSTTVPVCYQVPVVLPSKPSNAAGSTVDAVSITLDRAAIGVDGRAPAGINAALINVVHDDDCVQRTLSPAEIDKLLAWFGTTHSSCELSRVVEDGVTKVALGPSCGFSFMQAGEAAKTKGAKALVLPAVANWIYVTGAIAKEFPDERQLVAVLAHELTHYYRAHLLAPASEYEFLYQQDPTKPGRPARPDDATAAALAGVAAQIRAGENLIKDQLAVPGQALRSELFLSTLDLSSTIGDDVHAVCGDDAACASACDALKQAVPASDSAVPSAHYFGGDFPAKPLAADKYDAYLAYEKAFLGCADKVPMATPGHPGMSAFQLDNAIDRELSPGGLFTQLPDSATLGDALRARSAKLGDLEASVMAAYGRAKDLRFGYYTREQEADDGAVQHLYDLGLDPHVGIEMLLVDGALLEDRLGAPSPPETSARACDPLYRHNFNDEQGQPVYIHVGDLGDTHHSMCFRAYNQYREIKLNGYDQRAPADSVAPPSAPTWDELRQSTAW